MDYEITLTVWVDADKPEDAEYALEKQLDILVKGGGIVAFQLDGPVDD